MNQRFIMTSRLLLSKLKFQPKNVLQRRCLADNSIKNVEKPEPEQKYISPRDMLKNVVYPNDFEKRILVWTGRYKTVEEVPKKLAFEELYHAKTHFRIKVSNYLIGATIIGCLVAVYLGRQARARGDTVQKMNLEWHKEYNKKMENVDKKSQ